MNKKICKFLSVLLCVVISVSCNVVFADDNISSKATYHGITYNLFTGEQEYVMENVSIIEEGEQVYLTIYLPSGIYSVNMSYKNDGNFYDGMFFLDDIHYYCRLLESNDQFSGLIREIDETKNVRDVHQFGFLISSDDETTLHGYLNKLQTDSKTKDIITNNVATLHGISKDYAVSTADSLGQYHVFCSSWQDFSFGEIWANSSTPTSSGRYVTVTYYNLKIGVLGDQCNLSQWKTDDRATLYATPPVPPLGVQQVDRQYFISSSYSAQLNATVTGLYDVRGIPLPLPMIFADDINF